MQGGGGGGSFLTNRIKTLLFVVKHLLIKSQARITLKEILESHFWNSITVMVVVVLSCSAKLRSNCQKVLLIGIFAFELENLVFKPRNPSMEIEYFFPKLDLKY